MYADHSTNIISSYCNTVICYFSSAILEVDQVVSHQVSGPVVPYHAPSDDNQFGQLIPQQIQSVPDPSVQGKQSVGHEVCSMYMYYVLLFYNIRCIS